MMTPFSIVVHDAGYCSRPKAQWTLSLQTDGQFSFPLSSVPFVSYRTQYFMHASNTNNVKEEVGEVYGGTVTLSLSPPQLCYLRIAHHTILSR